MNKKRYMVGIILAIVSSVIIGSRIYMAHEENAIKNTVLEWIHSVESEQMLEAVVIDQRNGPYVNDAVYTDLTDEQKEAFCQAIQSISMDEVSIVEIVPHDIYFSIWYDAFAEGKRTMFKFNREVAYVNILPDELYEQNGYMVLKIKSNELNEFLAEFLE